MSGSNKKGSASGSLSAAQKEAAFKSIEPMTLFYTKQLKNLKPEDGYEAVELLRTTFKFSLSVREVENNDGTLKYGKHMDDLVEEWLGLYKQAMEGTEDIIDAVRRAGRLAVNGYLLFHRSESLMKVRAVDWVHWPLSIVQDLVAAGVDVNFKGQSGISPLFYVARRDSWNTRDIEIFDILVNAGATVSAKDNQGNTVLHLAAIHKNKGLVTYMLKNHQDEASRMINEKNLADETPLHLVLNVGKGERRLTAAIVEILLAHGADASIPNDSCETPRAMANKLDIHTVIRAFDQKAGPCPQARFDEYKELERLFIAQLRGLPTWPEGDSNRDRLVKETREKLANVREAMKSSGVVYYRSTLKDWYGGSEFVQTLRSTDWKTASRELWEAISDPAFYA